MSRPLLVETGPELSVPETERECPGDYLKYKTACFKFGDHSSYEMAKSACDSAGARLADIEPVFSKYIRDQVRTMGGNDFWVGSFVNRGKVFRQKGRTSCPIMRGQMINDALYGLVDCNSANRYICQKYGETRTGNQLDFNQGNPFYNGAFGLDSNAERPQRVNMIPKSTTVSTTTVAAEADSSTSPVIYAVISVCVIILVLVGLKFIISRYFSGDKKRGVKDKKEASVEDGKNNNSKDGGGQVFSPKWRKNIESKASSVDSAVPPSNHSLSLEKPPKENHVNTKTGDIRMGRPAVNGSVPTRKPPHLDGDIALHGSYHYRSREDRGREKYGGKRHRRTYSDPRSDYDFVDRDEYYSHRRRTSFYSEKSWSSSDSDYEYPRRPGPTKVYQRYPSENQVYRDSKHHYYGNNLLRNYKISRRESRDHRGHYGRSHYGRSKSNHGNIYNDGMRRHTTHREDRYASYGRRAPGSRDHRSSRIPSVSRKVQTLQEKQYFPQPHRLMSWVDPLELKDMSPPAAPLLQGGISHSISREPIWVNRQIHMPGKSKQSQKRSKKSRQKRGDDSHIYESLDELKRHKELKKAARRNKQKKKEDEEKRFKRNAHTRASSRSIASIQSRRLPTPPT